MTILVSTLESNKGLIMNKNEETISVNEAKQALEFSSKIERDTNAVARPPLWLSLIIAFFYAMMTYSWAVTRHENLWMLGLIISTIGFFLAVAFYLHSTRLLGVKPKLVPKSISEFKFHLFTALFFGAVFILTRVFSQGDVLWASYVGSAMNGSVLAYLLHNYSACDFKTAAETK